MDKSVRKVLSVEDQEQETFLYWRSRSDAERMDATWQLKLELYRMKGLVADAQRLQRSVVHLHRA